VLGDDNMKILALQSTLLNNKYYADIACVYSLTFFVRSTCLKSREILYPVI